MIKFIFIFKKFKRKDTGFTLVETLVAVSIFSVSILGLLVLLSNSIADTGYAKKKIIASYLAQEGIEYMRNMRDTFVLFDSVSSQNGWKDFRTKLNEASCNTDGCYFNDQNFDFSDEGKQITNINLNPCIPVCPALSYDSNSGKYGYGGGVNSGYTRSITTVDTGLNGTKIISRVTWTQGSGTYNVELSMGLLNWVE